MFSFKIGDKVEVLGHEVPSARGRTGTITELFVERPRARIKRHAVTLDFYPHEDPSRMPDPRFAFRVDDLMPAVDRANPASVIASWEHRAVEEGTPLRRARAEYMVAVWRQHADPSTKVDWVALLRSLAEKHGVDLEALRRRIY